MGVIFYLSSRTSDELRRFFPLLPDLNWGHVAAYFVLGLLYRFALERRGMPRPAFWAVTLSILYGVSDEYHQRFVPTREPDAADLAADAAGAVLAMVLWRLTARRRGRRGPGGRGGRSCAGAEARAGRRPLFARERCPLCVAAWPLIWPGGSRHRRRSEVASFPVSITRMARWDRVRLTRGSRPAGSQSEWCDTRRVPCRIWEKSGLPDVSLHGKIILDFYSAGEGR